MTSSNILIVYLFKSMTGRFGKTYLFEKIPPKAPIEY